MNEIELKFKIKNFDNLNKKIKDLGCIFEKKVTQIDTVYFEKNNKYFEIKPGTIVMRTRIINGKKKFITLKVRANDFYASKEIEFQVENSKKIEDFIETLGYVKAIDFTKERITTSYKNFNICIDQIDVLGDYIEIEVLTEDNNINMYKEQILNFAEKLGIDVNDLENRYYPQIILSKKIGGKK